MEYKNGDWELFAGTGKVDAYLDYKAAQMRTENLSNGEHQNEGSDNQEHRLR